MSNHVWLRSGSGDEDAKIKGDTAFSSKLLDMYSSIYTMRQDLERVKKPIGTKDNPVRTCRDLFYGHPQFGDGMWDRPPLKAYIPEPHHQTTLFRPKARRKPWSSDKSIYSS